MRRILLGSAAALAMFSVLPVDSASATHSTPLGACANPFQKYDGPDADGDGTQDIDCKPGQVDNRCVAPPWSLYGTVGIGGITTIGTGDRGTTFYIDDRDYLTGNGIWLYQEDNGTAGLQRGGDAQLYEQVTGDQNNEICDDGVFPDYLIF